MIVYVAHCYGGKVANFQRARQITKELQENDLDNCYICPLLTFAHLQYGSIGFDEEMKLCIDLLSVCDKLIVASDNISKGVEMEIDFANKVGMEVEFLEDT